MKMLIQFFSDSLFEAQCLFKRSDFPGKQNALEEAPEAGSFRRSTATIEASPENSRT